MKTKTKYTPVFHQEYYDGNKEILIRTFGTVIPDDKEIPLLVIAELYDLLESGAVREEEIPDITKPVMLSFSLLPELKYVHQKHIKGAQESGSLDEVTLVDVYEYMGGLRYEPSDVVWFESIEAAREHILSKQLNDKIAGAGMLSGYIMDQYYNRAGDTNWSVLNKIMNGK